MSIKLIFLIFKKEHKNPVSNYNKENMFHFWQKTHYKDVSEL